MVFLRAEMYNEAKASWTFCSKFSVTKDKSDQDKYVLDAWSEPKDHLGMFDGLLVSNDKLR